MFDTSRFDAAARDLVAQTALAFRAGHTHEPAQCPACEAGFHGENAESYHAVFSCACGCNR